MVCGGESGLDEKGRRVPNHPPIPSPTSPQVTPPFTISYTEFHVRFCLKMVHVCVLSYFSHVRLRHYVTPWTVAGQAPLIMGFSRQKYWSRLPCYPPERSNPVSCVSCIGRRVLYHQHHLGSPNDGALLLKLI